MSLIRQKKVNYTLLLIILFVVSIFPFVALANIGVGIGSGKITLQQQLKPGGIYEIPALVVLNTGDEPSEYGLSVEFNENQAELKPMRDWFSFMPASFHLEPGQSQTVKIVLSLPVKAAPGAYFAYLEAHPIKKDVPGQSSVGIASAAKLYFTVMPASIFQASYYRASYFLSNYAPWTYIILGILALALIILICKRFFKFSIGISVKSAKKKSKKKKR